MTETVTEANPSLPSAKLRKDGKPRQKTGPKPKPGPIALLKQQKPELWELKPLQACTNRKLMPQDVEAVARLVAMKLNLKEACLSLGINPITFKGYLDRNGNNVAFQQLESRLRGAYLSARLSEIEDAATNGSGKLKQPDWRASDRLLAIAAPERYSPQRQLTVTQAGKIQLGWLNTSSQAQVTDVESTPLIDNCGVDPAKG